MLERWDYVIVAFMAAPAPLPALMAYGDLASEDHPAEEAADHA